MLLIPFLVAAVSLPSAEPLEEIRPARSVIAEISRRANLPLSIETPLDKDYLYVKSEGASPGSLLRLIASALGATLTKKGSGFSIVRTSKDVARIKLNLVSARSSWIRRRLSELKAERLSSQRQTDARTNLVQAIERDTHRLQQFQSGQTFRMSTQSAAHFLPSELLIEDLIERIGIDRFASLPSGEIAVFEDDPTGIASELPMHDDLTEKYLTQMRSLPTDLVTPQLKSDWGKVAPTEYLDSLSWNQISPKLRLEVFPAINQIIFTLEGYDDLGNRNLLARIWVRPTDRFDFTAAYQHETEKVSKTAWLTLGEKAKEGIAFLKDSNPPLSISSKNPALPDWLRFPNAVEPLNLLIPDVARTLADEIPVKPTVIVCSDSWPRIALTCADRGRINMDAFKFALRQDLPYVKTEMEDGITWAPLDIERDEALRGSRKALSDFVQRVASTSDIDVRSISYLYHESPPDGYELADLWLNALQPRLAKTSIECDGGEQFYALLGSVSDDRWPDLFSGKPISTASLVQSSSVRDLFLKHSQVAKGKFLFPNRFTHAAEDLPQNIESDFPIICSKAEKPLIGVVQQGTITWRSVASFGARYPVPSEGFSVDGGKPTLRMTREEYQQGLANLKVASGALPSYAVQIGLENQMFYQAHIQGRLVFDNQNSSLSDLPESLQQSIWESAITSGLRRYNRARGFLQRATSKNQ